MRLTQITKSQQPLAIVEFYVRSLLCEMTAEINVHNKIHTPVDVVVLFFDAARAHYVLCTQYAHMGARRKFCKGEVQLLPFLSLPGESLIPPFPVPPLSSHFLLSPSFSLSSFPPPNFPPPPPTALHSLPRSGPLNPDIGNVGSAVSSPGSSGV